MSSTMAEASHKRINLVTLISYMAQERFQYLFFLVSVHIALLVAYATVYRILHRNGLQIFNYC